MNRFKKTSLRFSSTSAVFQRRHVKPPRPPPVKCKTDMPPTVMVGSFYTTAVNIANCLRGAISIYSRRIPTSEPNIPPTSAVGDLRVTISALLHARGPQITMSIVLIGTKRRYPFISTVTRVL